MFTMYRHQDRCGMWMGDINFLIVMFRVKKLAERGTSLAIIAKAKNEAFSQVFNLNLEIATISYSV